MTTDDTRRSDGQATGHTLTDAETTCDHFYVDRSPAGTSEFARICSHCHQPDPDWLNSLAARGGNTDNGLRAAWAHVVRDHDMPPNRDRRGYDYRMGWWDAVAYADRILTRGLRACADCPGDLDPAPAPTDNQRDDGLAEQVKAILDVALTDPRYDDSYGAAGLDRLVSDLRAVVDGASTGDGEGA